MFIEHGKLKLFCSDIKTKHLTFTRDNDIHLYSMTKKRIYGTVEYECGTA